TDCLMFAMGASRGIRLRRAGMLYTVIAPWLRKSAPSMRQLFFVVENPGAGVAGSPLVEEVVRLLAKSGGSVTRARSADIPAARLAVRMAAERGSRAATIAPGGAATR